MHSSAVAHFARSKVLTKFHKRGNLYFSHKSCLGAQKLSGCETTWRSQAATSSAASTELSAALGAAVGGQAAIRPISEQPKSLESSGFVVREAQHSLVPSDFHELLNSIVCSYQAACGDRLVGVYLRGSIPRGLFIPGISDVDTFGIVLPIATENNISSSSSEGDVSSAASLQDMQGAVRRLCEPAIQAHQHLGYTKVELKLLEVQPGSTAAAALELILNSNTNTDTSSNSSSSSRSESSASHCAGHTYTLRPSMCAAIPYAFELKVGSVVLSGLDLPELLPPSAALPPHYEVLPGLVDGVEDARLAVQEAAAAAGPASQLSKETDTAAPTGAVAQDMEVQVRATKWVLKRLLRAAFELVQDSAGVYTRDLFWCCHEAKQHLPQLQQQLSWGPAQQPLQQQQQQQLQELQQYWQQQLDSVLQHYIYLQATWMQLRDQQHQSHNMLQDDTAASDGAQRRLQQLVQGGWQLADSLLPKLEASFLKLMLVEEPGWLTHHLGHSIPASVNPNSTSGSGDDSSCYSDAASSGGSLAAAATAGSPATDSLQSVSQLQQLQQQEAPEQSPWLFAGKALQALQGLLQPAASAAAGAAKRSVTAAPGNAASTAVTGTPPTHVQQLIGAVPPAVKVPVVGQVTAFDWHEETAAAAAAVRDIILQRSSPVTTARSRKPQQTPAAGATAAADDELLGSWPQPVVLRGAAAAWPCVSQPWCLDWLTQQQDFMGKVRAAPSLQFPFVEPQLLDVLLKLRGRQAAPSLLVDMAAQEFVQRVQPGCNLPPVAYQHSEYYYWQADLPEHLQQQQQLSQLQDALAHDMGEQQQQQQPRHEWLALTQQPRLWVSPAGAVSPLHYDKSHSFLAQVAGMKRMLFFSRDQLHRLYCYPDTHLLRRRSRVNLVSPDLVRFPLFSDVAALEVVLEPGDVCVFPSDWPHYTESLGCKPAAGSDLPQAAGCSMSITFRCRPVGRGP